MAILALSTNVDDMKRRLGNIVVAFNKDGEPLTAEDFVSISIIQIMKLQIFHSSAR